MHPRESDNNTQILWNFRDETGLRPIVNCKANGSLQKPGNLNVRGRMCVQVLNGDEAFKKRVIGFIKSKWN